VGEAATLEVVLREGPYRDAVRALAPEAMADEHTLVVEGRTATEAWASYWELKLRAQAHAAANQEGEA